MDLPRSRATAVLGALALVAAGGAATAAQLATHAGPRPNGTAVTPVGFKVTPAGTQTPLGDLPLTTALSPDGKTMLVSNDGQGTQSLQVVDTATSKVVQTLEYATPKALFVGLAFSPDGTKAYAGGGGQQVVHAYDVQGGRLTETTPYALPKTNPAGQSVNMFPGGLDTTDDGSRLVVADHLADAVSVIDTTTRTAQTVAVGHTPYTAVVHGSTAYVSNQGAGTVSVLDLSSATPVVTRTIGVGTHPNAEVLSADGSRLFVANGDSDDVSVVDTASGSVTRTVSLAPYDNAKVGSNPVGLALSPDGKTLYVSNSGNNAVAVVDVDTGKVGGTIPTAWYPTGVVATKDKLLIANAKGLGAGPNDGPGHPDPTSTTPRSPDQYVGSMMKGTLSTVPLPLSGDRLASYTRTVAANDGFDRPVPGADGTPKIKHVIYVVQENRTYDQVFGSLGKGNGDQSLNLFGEESAPNPRQLASAVRHARQLLRERRGQRAGLELVVARRTPTRTPSRCGRPTTPAARALPVGDATTPRSPRTGTRPDPTSGTGWPEQGVSFRNYGFYVERRRTTSGRRPGARRDTDHAFRGFDLAAPTARDLHARSATCGTPRFTEWRRSSTSYVADGRPARASSSSGCPTTTPRAPSPARRRPGRTSRTTTSPSAGSSTRSRTRSTGTTRRSS